MQTPDLVIRGGTVVDGSGAPAFEADVVVEGDRIVAIGKHDGAAGEVIDAKGKIVTPGFVDVHTHLDAQITWDPLGSPSNLHGVTSVIVGNCGIGFAPCKPQDRDYLMFLMEGVEDVPQAALKAGLRWDWETFTEYLEALARQRLGLNVGAHLSHAPLRVYVMGERGAADTPATDEELRLMQQHVRAAMQAGALGFDTGRTTVHRTPAWDPVPGTFADRRELSAIATALAESGTGVLELVPYGGAGEDARGFEKEFDWMEPVARECGRPISVSLIQNLRYPDVWREVIERAAAANQRGARIVPQVAARSVGVLLGFGCALSPLSLFPAAFDLIVDRQTLLDRDGNDDQNQQPRHGEADVRDAPNDNVDFPPVVRGDKPQDGSYADAQEARDEPNAQGERCPGHHDGQQVPPLPVRAKGVLEGGGLECGRRQGPGLIRVHDEMAYPHKQHQSRQKNDPNDERDVAAHVARHTCRPSRSCGPRRGSR